MANISPASETNPRKIKLGIHPEVQFNSARAENPSPVWSNRARIFIPGWLRPGLKKSHVIETEFQPGLKTRKQYGCR